MKWYEKYHFISHGGGGIDGKTQTDSLDAWKLSYSRGNRVFDADLSFTSDRKLVLRHYWGDNLEQTQESMRMSNRVLDSNGHVLYHMKQPLKMTYEQFISTPVFMKYKPMDCEDMINFMMAHKDLYIAVDTHSADIENVYKYLVDCAKKMNADDILKRIIVNVYTPEELEPIMKIYKFENITARQHYVRPNNYYELLNFCLKNNIRVVNVSSVFMKDEGIKLLRDHGIYIFTAVADYISDMQDFKNMGASGAVSSFLYEDDWKYIR